MCGICGVWGERDEKAVRRMMQVLRHRGPDDNGFFADERVTLGHTRLAILDVSAAGHQPMSNEEGTVWINYNGELYNFAEERAGLQKRGHSFRTNCDTEVVLRLYEVHGDAFLTRLRGMFALAIYDRSGGPGRERLLLARDPLGVKPLLYSGDAGRLFFASELKALLASRRVHAHIDPAALEDLLAFGSVAQPRTLLAGVHALLPGHRLVAEPDRLVIERYTKLDTGRFASIRGLAYQDQVRELRRVLEDTVRLHMVSDVPVGAFLSGGIDSTVLCGLMARMSSHRLRTFSVGYKTEGAALDESNDAARAAAFLGTEHRRVLVTGDDVRREIEKIAEALDQPSVDGVNSYFVCAAAAGHVKVAISGTGGDELFAGYPWFAAMARAERRRQSASLGALGGRLLAALASRSALDALPGALVARVLDRARAQGDLLAFFARQYQVFGTARARTVLSCELRDSLAAPKRGRDRVQPADELLDAPIIARVSALCLRGYAQNQLLRDIDAVSMAHSLEVRVPLLDPILTDFTLALPDAAKLGDAAAADSNYQQSGAKRVLIDATRDILPPDIDRRPKRGFTMPFDAWLRGPLRDVLGDTLSPNVVTSRGLFDSCRVSAIKHDFMRGRAPWSLTWLLMMTELWCRRVIDARAA